MQCKPPCPGAEAGAEHPVIDPTSARTCAGIRATSRARSARLNTALHPAPVYRRVFETEFTAARAALLAGLRALRTRCGCACLLGNAEIVIAEVINNVIEHAHAGRSGRIELALYLSPAAWPPDILCSVRDDGACMPDTALAPATMAGVEGPEHESLAEGGFGWQLIRTLARDIRYRRRDGLNQLDFCVGPGH